MGAPEKPIFDVEEFTNCSGIDALLAAVVEPGCQNAIESLETGPIDLREYCECSDYDGPEICTLCADDQTLSVNNTDQLEILGGYSCSQIADLAAASVDEETCSSFGEATPICCLGGNATAEQCTICEDGAAFQNPGREIFLLLGRNCSDYNSAIAEFAVAPFCDLFPFFDMRAFCGCDGTSPPNTCEFCEVTNPDEEVYIAAINETLTCDNIADLAMYTTDENLCDIFPPLETKCCSAPTSNPTSSASSTFPTFWSSTYSSLPLLMISSSLQIISLCFVVATIL